MNPTKSPGYGVAATIAVLATAEAAKREGAAASVSAIVECTVGALEPLICGLFNGGTLQERLLFSLSLVGASATLTGHNGDHHQLAVSISPSVIAEAIGVYAKLTGADIKPYLPAEMVKFSEAERPTLN